MSTKSSIGEIENKRKVYKKKKSDVAARIDEAHSYGIIKKAALTLIEGQDTCIDRSVNKKEMMKIQLSIFYTNLNHLIWFF